MNTKATIIVITITMLLASLFIRAMAAETVQVFNAVTANKEFDAINLQLSTHNKNSGNLKKAINTIEKLNSQAQKCIDDNHNKSVVLEDFLKQTQVDKSVITQNENYKYLQGKISQYSKLASNCRLFMIRTQVAIIAYKQDLQKLSTEKTLERSPPTWHLFQVLTVSTLQNINFKKIYEISGIPSLKYGDGIVLALLIAIGLALGVYAKSVLRLLFKNTVTARFRRTIKTINNYGILILPVSLMLSCYFSFIYLNVTPTPSLELLSYAVFLYLIVINLIKVILFSLPRFAVFKKLLHHQIIPIYKKLKLIASIIFSYFVLQILFRQQHLPASLVEGVTSLYFMVLMIVIAWFFGALVTTLYGSSSKYRIGMVLQSIIIIELILILSIQVAGYHRLASYIFVASILTIVLSLMTWLILKFIETVINFLENNKSQMSQRLRYFLGAKPYRRVTEFTTIQYSLKLVIISFYIILLLKIWKLSTVYADQTLDALLHGIKFGGLELIPFRIILAVIIFSLSLLGGRFVATHVARHHQFEGEKDTQVAVASIIKYAWVAVTVIIALLISGFNFTNLAIIAGALSVGIGLGMQHIVTNFVSGLILLLEKPIKPGDRIAVGNIEGFVRKIRARSTQITTPANEDVIIPNADLISQPVTNYMFRNRLWRVTCQVGVSYDSDVLLVEKLLLDVANKHPDVLKDVENKPTVCFQEFGVSSLNFILWSVISDVNKKSHVLSDLNIAIYMAFKKHNIVIAFPQIDVHIKHERPDVS